MMGPQGSGLPAQLRSGVALDCLHVKAYEQGLGLHGRQVLRALQVLTLLR